jgi:hypothetical protein
MPLTPAGDTGGRRLSDRLGDAQRSAGRIRGPSCTPQEKAKRTGQRIPLCVSLFRFAGRLRVGLLGGGTPLRILLLIVMGHPRGARPTLPIARVSHRRMGRERLLYHVDAAEPVSSRKPSYSFFC